MTLFDPERGRPIVAPPCAGPGCWAGAPGGCRDGRDAYLVYRMRRPQPGRGYELRIAASHDGLRYDTVWSAGKDRFGAESIERCALARVGDTWRLYVSFVRRDDRRWRMDSSRPAPSIDSIRKTWSSFSTLMISVSRR